jgi:hypothetical protein
MKQFSRSQQDISATYRICVIGVVESSMAKRFWGMTSVPVEQTDELEQTALVGAVVDQAALVGIINALHNGGLTVVSVERIFPDKEFLLNKKNKKD